MLFRFACVCNMLSVSFAHFHLYRVVGNILVGKKVPKIEVPPNIRNPPVTGLEQ